MPIIKSAIKKMRQDKFRTARNRKRAGVLKTLIKKARTENSPASLKAVFSALDKAVKTNLIHRNKASRLKSRLSKGNSATQKTSKKKAVKHSLSASKKVLKKST